MSMGVFVKLFHSLGDIQGYTCVRLCGHAQEGPENVLIYHVWTDSEALYKQEVKALKVEL